MGIHERAREATGLVLGQRVKIGRAFTTDEAGCGLTWLSGMEEDIGTTHPVCGLNAGFVSLNGLWWPWFILQPANSDGFASVMHVDLYNGISDAMNFQAGDLVKIWRPANEHELGWQNSWPPNMRNFVGCTGHVVGEPNRLGVQLGELPYSWPCFILQKVVEVTLNGRKLQMPYHNYKSLYNSLAVLKSHVSG